MPRRASFALALLPVFAAAALADETFEQSPEVAESRVAGTQAETPTEEPADTVTLEGGPKPRWIWGAKPAKDDDVWFLRKTFDADGIQSAQLLASCDNRMQIFVNGRRVLESSEWERPEAKDITRNLKPEGNEIVVRAANAGGVAGFALKLVLVPVKGPATYIVTDDSWEALKSRDAKEATQVAVVGTMGDDPWKDVFANPAGRIFAGNVERNVFQTLPGFQVERLYTVPNDDLGSWVCITTDDQGRLLVSDQGDKGLCRVTPSPIGSDEPTKVERLDIPMTGCHGMLWAFGRLYCSVNGGPGSGFYMCEDTDGDDELDTVTKLQDLKGAGEHGPHSIRLAPDGKSLYVIAGNHTDLPEAFETSRLPSNWDEDLLLPRQWDAQGHARGKLAPGGWIAKVDPEGKDWEIVSSGYRNPFDMAFNADGELFAYDADMEWDIGSPWYRPTRVCHATSGSEFGWRSGTGKWPAWYPDSLPAAVDIGPGSPVGVTFGYGLKFPARFQKALFLLDWTFGTIYTIDLKPEGSTYVGEKHEFLSRTPLPLTDAVVGPDGALYFTVGGRGTQSELFRVTYVGDESTEPVDATDESGQELREVRHRLEAMHRAGEISPQELEIVWQNLGNEDRFVRYAARVALENQPVASWRDRLDHETNAERTIEASIALARQGGETDLEALLAALGRLEFAKLDERLQLDLLRAYGLAFIRLGEPDQATKAELVAKFDPFFPSKSRRLNRDLAQMLVYLESPTIVTKALAVMEEPYERSTNEMGELLARNPGYGGTIAQMLANQPELDNIFLALALRNVKYGWTLEQRKQYVQWIEKAKGWSGGASYTGFLDNIKKEALENASPAELQAIEADVVAYKAPSLEELPKPRGPGHDWTVDDVVALAGSGLTGRSFENGQRAFAAAQCIRCHRFAGEGGATGPDLTNVAGRFGFKDLAEALVDPSKVISDQYRANMILTIEGKQVIGRVLNETDDALTVLVDPVDSTKVVELARDDVEANVPSKTSLMPNDLIDTLGEEEVLDLMAYLYSRGNPNDRMFAE